MPRLDAARMALWRDLRAVVGDLERRVDDDLRAEWDIGLGWFDLLEALARAGGTARPHDLAAALGLPPSSVSRRLDRLEEEGWVVRRRPDGDPPGRPARRVDGRAVEVDLTASGRRLWREMGVHHRRAVQRHVASHLDDDDVADLRRVLDRLPADRPTP